MKALVKSRPEPGLELTEVPQPKPGANEVLIRVRKTGICGTDLHIYNWDDWARRNIRTPRIIRDEIVAGMDELGVLLMGAARGVYWYGSRLSIEEARQLAPYNNATSMQVAAGVLGGMVWALRNPAAGVVEPDDLDHALVLEIARPYLGELVGSTATGRRYATGAGPSMRNWTATTRGSS